MTQDEDYYVYYYNSYKILTAIELRRTNMNLTYQKKKKKKYGRVLMVIRQNDGANMSTLTMFKYT